MSDNKGKQDIASSSILFWINHCTVPAKVAVCNFNDMTSPVEKVIYQVTLIRELKERQIVWEVEANRGDWGKVGQVGRATLI